MGYHQPGTVDQACHPRKLRWENHKILGKPRLHSYTLPQNTESNLILLREKGGQQSEAGRGSKEASIGVRGEAPSEEQNQGWASAGCTYLFEPRTHERGCGNSLQLMKALETRRVGELSLYCVKLGR